MWAGGLLVGAALACYMVATLLTSLADAVFLIYTGPLFCTILARIFRHEKISAAQAACLVAVFVGMLCTSGIIEGAAASLFSNGDGGFGAASASGDAGGGMASSSADAYPNKALGDALGLASGVLYGISLFCNGYRRDCDTVVRGVWNFIFATVGAGAVTAVMMVFWPLGTVDMSATNWVFAVILWIVCGPVGLGLLLVAGKNLSAVEYSTIAYWECVVSVLASVLVFGEALTVSTIIGGVLIIAGGALPAVLSLRRPAI
jgi:drug/metabolite transporter (DMT)-like permease